MGVLCVSPLFACGETVNSAFRESKLLKDKFRKTALVLLLGLLAHGVSADELTDRAKGLLDQGKAVEAFRLLDAVERERAGDPVFDLLLGIAAVDIGQNTRGVFALERVLVVQPGNARARAEIARAYLALGETKNARQEFETVQKQGVPDEVGLTIDRFLDTVDRIDSATRPTLRGYLEGSFGYDTNINAGPNRDTVQIAVPGFGKLEFDLAKESRSNKSAFGTLGGGLNYRAPINSSLAFVGGISGVLRDNFRNLSHDYDTLSADAYVGLVLNKDKNVFSLNAQHNHFELESDRYRTASGFSGQWQYNHDARNQSSAFVQYANLRYQQQSIRNADRWVAGFGHAHGYRNGAVTWLSAYWVDESPKDGDVPWLGHDGPGLRIGGQINLGARTVFFANGSVEHRRYDAKDITFNVLRKDTQYDLSLGINYTPVRHWKITPKLSLTRNNSNTDLNDYHRETVSVTARYDF